MYLKILEFKSFKKKKKTTQTKVNCFMMHNLVNERRHTLKASAKGEWVDSNCCWTVVACSTIPFWNVESTWSNIALHDISNAGTTEASRLDFNASYTQRYDYSYCLNRSSIHFHINRTRRKPPIVEVIKQRLHAFITPSRRETVQYELIFRYKQHQWRVIKLNLTFEKYTWKWQMDSILLLR